ncbi:uncharacterized protein LOC143281079 [Babylonia areolata]|uniref:uncharacterized protein LOC143281079 n=1 Tax=Babylonia areolata TaxID=304850 RepID=UPI003FD19F33
MPDTMSLPRPHHPYPVRSSKEFAVRQVGGDPSASSTSSTTSSFSSCSPPGFPEYLKHVDMLGDSGSRVRFSSSNNLFQAVLKGRVRSTEYLLDRGTSVDGRNDYGFSVLTAALHVDNAKRRDTMFRLLLERGADPHFKDDTHERNVLHWACILGRAEQVEVLLREVAADLDLRDRDLGSYTALHHAVMAGHLPVVTLLVDIHRKFGVTVDLADNLGLTPYLHAKRLGYREVAECLHSKGQASLGHGDLLFRTPREWSQIGRFERKKALVTHAQEAINNAKIQGKITHLRNLRQTAPNTSLPNCPPSHTPRARLAVRHADRLSTSLPSLQEDGRPRGMRRPTSANGAADAEDRGVDHVDSEPTHGRAAAIPRHPREAFVHPAVPTLPLKQPGGHPRQGYLPPPRRWEGAGGLPAGPLAPIGEGGGRGGSMEGTGVLSVHPGAKNNPAAALTLMEMNKKGRHASTYRQSQFDETKASEYRHILGNINSIMDILSQQQSISFRKSVKYQRPETPKKVKVKPKVSSLAVIFGRDKGGRRSSKRTSARSARKKESASTRKKKEKGAGGEKTKAKTAEQKKRLLPVVKVNDKVL